MLEINSDVHQYVSPESNTSECTIEYSALHSRTTFMAMLYTFAGGYQGATDFLLVLRGSLAISGGNNIFGILRHFGRRVLQHSGKASNMLHHRKIRRCR